jgi:sirohydrochlorin cobaltochelatase
MNPSFDSGTGVVLFAHGSRDPLWRLPIDAVAQHMAAQWPNLPVAVAFLEMTQPDLPSTIEHMMKQGLSHVRIVPMFFWRGSPRARGFAIDCARFDPGISPNALRIGARSG